MSRQNIINGTPGNDKIIGDRSDPATGFVIFNDIIYGFSGDDYIDGGERGGDRLYGGDGNDTLIVQNNEGGVLVYGEAGDDTFYVGGVAQAGAQGPLVDGGPGNDTAIILVSQAFDVVINLSAGVAGARSAPGTTFPSLLFRASLVNIENVIGTGFDDFITGNDANNILEGRGGDDYIEGGNGNDIIRVGSGSGIDYAYGGAGEDTIDLSDKTGPISISLASTAQVIIRLESSGFITEAITIRGFENIRGTVRNDTLSGDGYANKIDGNQGDDLLTGGGGADIFVFSGLNLGQDTITDFSLADDWLYIRSGTTSLDALRTRTESAGNTTLFFDAGSVTIRGIVGLSLAQWQTYVINSFDPLETTLAIAANIADGPEGESGSKSFTFSVTRNGNIDRASSATWTVAGAGSNPANAADFVGGVLPTGTVSFAAGQSTQTITVHVAGDNLVESDEAFTVTLSVPIGATISRTNATGIIRRDEVIVLNGTAGHDVLIGGADPETINGLSGDDRLTGGAGNDSLEGGIGSDTAIFSGQRTNYEVTRSGSTVTIRDLRANADGTDTLTGIEQVQFSDGVMGLVPEELVMLLPGSRDLIAWDSTRGSNGFRSLLRVGSGDSVAATADFTGDGRTDFVFRQANGNLFRWDVSLGSNGFASLPRAAGSTIVGVGDLTGSAASDILLQDGSGRLSILDAAAGQIVPLLTLSAGWSVVGVANINGTGRSDVVLQNLSGTMIAFTDTGWRDLLTLSSGWRVAGFGDVTGGLADDFILQNSSGTAIFWDATQGSAGWRDFATLAPGWSIKGFHDLTGDGRDDVLIQNNAGIAIAWNGTGWTDLGSVLVGTEFVGTGVFP